MLIQEAKLRNKILEIIGRIIIMNVTLILKGLMIFHYELHAYENFMRNDLFFLATKIMNSPSSLNPILTIPPLKLIIFEVFVNP